MFLRTPFNLRLLLATLCFLVVGSSLSAQNTQVKGIVVDAKTLEPLPFANIVFNGTLEGNTADLDGNFLLETANLKLISIQVSYLGYKTKTIDITPGTYQVMTVMLETDGGVMGEEIVVIGKRPKKDTAAITLYRKIVERKPFNRADNLDSYSYENYLKTEFDLYDYNPKLKNNIFIEPFAFVFENTDTTEDGKVFLPAMLREKMSDVYYTQVPKRKKEIIKGERFSGVENMSLGDVVDHTFEDINIYDNLILLGGKSFVSPFSDMALPVYKYFISDSAMIDGQWCYKLDFITRRKQDLGFTGYAWIHDSTAAIKAIEFTILDKANLNFVNDFVIRQQFLFVDNQYWFKNREQMFLSLNVTKRKQKNSFRVVKTASRGKITINKPINEDMFRGYEVEKLKEADQMDDKWWAGIRHESLTKTEASIYKMVDSVQSKKAYKTYVFLGHFITTGFFRAGPVEIGRLTKFFSWNNIEGNRYRISLRTNRRFSERVHFSGYLAYGQLDKEWKYQAYFRSHLHKKGKLFSQIALEYRYDFSQVNQSDARGSHDDIFNSLLRNRPLSKLMKERAMIINYDKELMQDLWMKVMLQHRSYYEIPGVFAFNQVVNGDTVSVNRFTSADASVRLRWTPGNKYIQTAYDRIQVTFDRPTLTLKYTMGIKGILNSQFNYHQLELGISQKIPMGVMGFGRYNLYAGKTFGDLPYPFLTIHRGNQGYMFNRFAFNMMNEFEYLSDEYAALWYEQHFEGIVLNQIPLIKKLKWREVVSFRGLWGRLTTNTQDVVVLPEGIKDLDGFYAEVGVGIENIFSILRVDAIWRLTQRNDPNVMRFGVRFSFSPSF